MYAIRTNNKLMSAHLKDRNQFYRIMKSFNKQKTTKSLQELSTPLGTYYGNDTLEGFAADAEYLGQLLDYHKDFDNDFRKLCIEDNKHIFELNNSTEMNIPELSRNDLNKIVDKELKNGKACDIYKLTPEHLKHCDQDSREVIRNHIY